MLMKIRNSLMGLLLAIPFFSQGQLQPVFSQYYFNELVINPAYAGAHVQFSANSTYRNQWINFPGAPKTLSASAHSSFFRGRIGVGFLVNVDKIGSYSNKDLNLSLAYKLKFPHSTLSFGLQPMFYFVAADFSDLTLKQPIDMDPSFNPINASKINFGTGIYYNRKNFFVGFSIPYLMNSTLEGIQSELKQKRNYFLRSGIIRKLDRKGDFKINPNILIRNQEGQPMSVDLNAGVIFYDVFSAGVSYRSASSFISFVSLKLSEKLYMNYSFDFTQGDLRPFASGTHEFMINYRAKITQAHKNLGCPTYHNYRE